MLPRRSPRHDWRGMREASRARIEVVRRACEDLFSPWALLRWRDVVRQPLVPAEV